MSNVLERPKSIVLYKVWGGSRLAQAKNIQGTGSQGEKLGEVLEVSDLENLKTLKLEESLCYLFKLIDTSKPLSVQVHPDDQYARLHEKSTGKSECWYILEADQDSKIYLGLKLGVQREEIEQVLKTGGDLSQLMKSYSPKAGDFFTVPAGTIHAIGKGITLAEVQQPSGVTYRFWDWGRVGPDGTSRELHIRQAFDVLKLEDHAESLKSETSDHMILWEGPGFVVKKKNIKPAHQNAVIFKKFSTLFALENMIYEYEESQNSLERWGSLFIKEDLELFLQTEEDREVQCLIIEQRG